MSSIFKNKKSETKIEKETLVNDLLSRSVSEILPSKDNLREILLSDKKLNVYIGADATGSSLHLGHATNYIILEKFRKLGHNVFILIGDFTARIGDPTDKTSTRVQLSRKEVTENAKDWLRQLEPIIDVYNKSNKVNVVYNHDWLSKLDLEDIIDLSSNFTVQQMLERDMFEKRIKGNKPIYMHEFFYPLMQGYDSVFMDIDVEICGNDQKFNAMMGRTLVKRYKKKEKFVFITNLLENPKTKEKMMSKSLGAGVFLDMDPDQMFEKIMEQADENIPQLYMDCTYKSEADILSIKKSLDEETVNPRDLKMELAKEIVGIYYGHESAEKASQNFISIFQKGLLPENIKSFKITKEKNILELVVAIGFAPSKTKATKEIEQGSIKVNPVKIGLDFDITHNSEFILQKGKKEFVKVIL